jgi:RNA-splicing ligase RtcB
MECQEIAVIELRAPPSSLTANGNMMAVGLEDGAVYVFQSELIRRRFAAMNSGSSEGDSNRSAMLDKLRRLRE